MSQSKFDARCVWHTVLLWDDDLDWRRQLLDLIAAPDAEVFWIRHDHDQSKVHRHVVVRFKSGITPSAVSKRFLINSRNVRAITKKDERTGGINAFCKYLLHSDRRSRMLGKALYRIDSFCGPDRQLGIDKAARFEAEPDEYGLADIICYIKSKRVVSMEDVVPWCIAYKCLSVLRRYQSIVRTLISEHNTPLKNLEFVADIDRRIRTLEDANRIASPAAAVVGVDMDLINDMLRKKK